MKSGRKTKKASPAGISSRKDPGGTIAGILRRRGVIPAAAPPDPGAGGRLFVILDEDTPEEARREILQSAAFTVDLGEDLLLRISELESENRQLRSLSLTDELTGLYNKRFFSLQLAVEMARSQRTGQPCCLAMVDLDHFKEINDTLGHMEGDRFLREVSHEVRDRLRPTDFLCRLGGDEFAVLMPATHLPDAVGIARRLQQFIGDLHWKGVRTVTASIGVGEYDPSFEISPDDFFNLTDMELYRAKKAGKNRISSTGALERRHRASQPVSLEEREILLNIKPQDD